MTHQKFSKLNKSILVLLIFFLGCSKKEPVLFKNITAEKMGIQFINQITETKDLSILDYLYFYNGGGVAVGDINNDDLPDIFFSGNQVKNKLYMNKGNMQFEEVAAQAGVSGNSSWNTGAVMGDVNGDGLLDIYVCAVVGINGFGGYNELYINNGNGTFTESASKYKLDFDSFSSNAAFLDYDLDGDLDIYLLNHAVHTQQSYGHANLRLERNYQTGDKLLRNDNGYFTDVSEQAGIFGGTNGYGLGIAISDFNNDGYPDVYVGNDFHEDDYYYLNNGNGTFTEALRTFFGHTSKFSMGNDVADINHDGLPDLFSLDMHAENEVVLKSSEGDEDFQIQKLRLKQFGYYYQFVRNMMQVNTPDGNFKETALLSGIASTDWSWSALFADYNQDGEQDIFVSNGILKRPNDLDYIKYVSNDQIVKKINTTNLVDKKALEKMPDGKVANYIFKGKGNLEFENKSNQWISNNKPSVSGATAMADLDNDGDLDIVINNLNELPTILENQTNKTASYLKLKLKNTTPNTFAIGSKVYAYTNGRLQYKELYTVRGFQASSEPMIHFGFGSTIKKIDSIKIVWPNKTSQTLQDVSVNQTLLVSPENTKPWSFKKTKKQVLFSKDSTNLGINFTHQEDNYIDFIRQKLIPYQLSDRGPAVAVGDLNGDGKEDIFFGGSKFKESKIFIQKDTGYKEFSIPNIKQDDAKEQVNAVIADFNNDAKNDLFVTSGGGDFFNKANQLTDSYYVQENDSTFISQKLPAYFQNSSVIKPMDYDNDGDLDLFVGGYAITNDFGKQTDSYLLENIDGNLELSKIVFKNLRFVTDAIWSDFNNDDEIDLILVGEWMAPKFYANKKGVFTEVKFQENLTGLWQTLKPFDIDADGDIDYVLGNWGTNSKFKASNTYPIKMYYGDFDDNGQTETIVCTEKNGNYYPILGLDELSSQLVFLKKKFNSYKEFAGKTIEEVLDKKMLEKAEILEVNTLKSGYLENIEGTFKFVPFLNNLQVAPIKALLVADFDNNGTKEMLVAGNYFGVAPFHGRFDGFSGAIIYSNNNIKMGDVIGLDLTKKAVKSLDIISLKNQKYILITINNNAAEVYKILK